MISRCLLSNYCMYDGTCWQQFFVPFPLYHSYTTMITASSASAWISVNKYDLLHSNIKLDVLIEFDKIVFLDRMLKETKSHFWTRQKKMETTRGQAGVTTGEIRHPVKRLCQNKTVMHGETGATKTHPVQHPKQKTTGGTTTTGELV